MKRLMPKDIEININIPNRNSITTNTAISNADMPKVSLSNCLNAYDKQISEVYVNANPSNGEFMNDVLVSVMATIKASFVECLRENKNMSNICISDLAIKDIFDSIESMLRRMIINRFCTKEESIVLHNTVGSLMRIAGADRESIIARRLSAMIVYICNLIQRID